MAWVFDAAVGSNFNHKRIFQRHVNKPGGNGHGLFNSCQLTE